MPSVIDREGVTVRRMSVVAVFVGLLVGLLGVVSAAPALANNDPHRFFVPAGDVDLPAGFCSFPTHYELLANKVYVKATTLPDGSVALKGTGALRFRATNVDTGTSVVLNASGPGVVTIHPDNSFTVNGQGHWLVFNFASDAAPFGLPAVMLTSGRLYEEVDSSGALTALSVTGQVTDVCAALS
jgi:hypothetical protein